MRHQTAVHTLLEIHETVLAERKEMENMELDVLLVEFFRILKDSHPHFSGRREYLLFQILHKLSLRFPELEREIKKIKAS